jgi:hypothetical protein
LKYLKLFETFLENTSLGRYLREVWGLILGSKRGRERVNFRGLFERKNKGLLIGQITYGLENKMKG